MSCLWLDWPPRTGTGQALRERAERQLGTEQNCLFCRPSKKSEKSEKKFQPTLETRFWEVCNTSFKGRSSWKKGIAGPIRTRWDPSLAAKRGGRCAACSRATRTLGGSMWPSPKPTAIQRHPSKSGCAGFDASARGATLGACGGLTRFRTSHPACTGQTEHPAKAPTHPPRGAPKEPYWRPIAVPESRFLPFKGRWLGDLPSPEPLARSGEPPTGRADRHRSETPRPEQEREILGQETKSPETPQMTPPQGLFPF